MRRRSTGHPRNFAIELDLFLQNHRNATYGFEIAARPQGAFAVKSESLSVRSRDGAPDAFYHVNDGEVDRSSRNPMPPVSSDRLYLVTAASLPEFREVYDALLSMGFYNLNPDKMKELVSPDAGEILRRDGDNLPSVIARIQSERPQAFERIRDYLKVIVPGIDEVSRVALGPRETLEFRQYVKGASKPWRFYAANMSDGTLRALGALVAVAQLADHESPVSLVGIEEPETALHPAAAGALVDALREAAAHTQVVATTHSPDLLDHLNLEQDALLVVASKAGTTEVASPDPGALSSIREHLYTPGELLRMGQLATDVDRVRAQAEQLRFQFELADDEDEA